jgi:hypothetical protein
MNGEAVDEWVAAVDQLLDGARGDRTMSDDAMRWSPDPKPPTPIEDLLQCITDAVTPALDTIANTMDRLLEVILRPPTAPPDAATNAAEPPASVQPWPGIAAAQYQHDPG